ncbi:MAG: hypothetical protein ACYTF7_01605 [Planctomycetota bacterium]|jgi:type II secretory pathway pseudopilin PulG
MRKLPKVFDWFVILALLVTLSAIVSPRFTSAGQTSLREGLSQQIEQLQEQIDQYALEHGGSYPELGGSELSGWGPLLEGEYINEVAWNLHVNKASLMAVEATPEVLTSEHHVNQTDIGWFYNPSTGRIIANGFDHVSGTFHDESGYEPKKFAW